VGFDGSAGSAAALRWAAAAASRDGSGLDIVAVWTPPVPTVVPWVPVPEIDHSTLRASFARFVENAARDAGVATPAPVRVVDGAPGPALVEAAGERSCLVVGRRGHGGFASLLLGSVADHCLERAKGPLVLVPPDDASAADGAVVVGVDGSAGSLDALRYGAELAARQRRPLVALHAWDWLGQPGRFLPQFDADAATRYATDVVARVLGERPVEVVAVNDLAASALNERSARGDTVVVGRRGLGAIRSSLAGSVSRQLAHHAPSAVVVVNRDASPR
jgi:nucleotide-binding universal stress UspA family protein